MKMDRTSKSVYFVCFRYSITEARPMMVAEVTALYGPVSRFSTK